MNNNILFLPSLFLHVVKIELEFLNALQINDTVNQLAEMVPSHPEDPDSNLIRRLYVLCRGIKDDKKYELLNTRHLYPNGQTSFQQNSTYQHRHY